MAGKTHDWTKLKAEFIKGDYKEITKFCKHKFGKYTGTMRTNMKGWRKEKEKLHEKALKDAIKKTEGELLELYKPSIKKLSKIKKSAFKILEKELKRLKKDPRLDLKSFEKVWKIIKTECGEPTSISNLLHGEDKNNPVKSFSGAVISIREKREKWEKKNSK